MNDLTGFQRDILYVVCGLGRPHGLAVKSELETYYGESINQGRLYPNLDALVDRGLIDKGQKNKRTNYYELTERGLELVLSRRMWEDGYLVRQLGKSDERLWSAESAESDEGGTGDDADAE